MWVAKLITILAALAELITSFKKAEARKEILEEQKAEAKEIIAHADNIRANSDKLSDDLLIAPEKRTTFNVLDLSPDIRGGSSGGSSAAIDDKKPDQSS